MFPIATGDTLHWYRDGRKYTLNSLNVFLDMLNGFFLLAFASEFTTRQRGGLAVGALCFRCLCAQLAACDLCFGQSV